MTHPSPLIFIDPKAGADNVFVLESDAGRSVRYRPLSIHLYRQDVSTNIAKGLFFPRLRGTWLPSFNKQVGIGLAINWLGIRVRVSLP